MLQRHRLKQQSWIAVQINHSGIGNFEFLLALSEPRSFLIVPIHDCDYLTPFRRINRLHRILCRRRIHHDQGRFRNDAALVKCRQPVPERTVEDIRETLHQAPRVSKVHDEGQSSALCQAASRLVGHVRGAASDDDFVSCGPQQSQAKLGHFIRPSPVRVVVHPRKVTAARDPRNLLESAKKAITEGRRRDDSEMLSRARLRSMSENIGNRRLDGTEPAVLPPDPLCDLFQEQLGHWNSIDSGPGRKVCQSRVVGFLQPRRMQRYYIQAPPSFPSKAREFLPAQRARGPAGRKMETDQQQTT